MKNPVRQRSWERLKGVFKTALPKRFGGVDALVQTTQSETRGDDPPRNETVDATQRDATLAVVRHPTQAHEESHSLSCGQTVAGRFNILRFVNRGGMGEVFEAWDSDLRERVAIKTIRHEIASFPSVIDRFKREVRQARAISHVNVCRVYEVYSHVQITGERVWFLTMELLEGQTLAERLGQRGPIPTEEALDLVEQMIAGLAAAHELGVVHRDFKSSNVMLVDTPGGKTRAVVTDFGLALNVLTNHYIDPQQSKEGTPRYMAPEQVQGGEVGFAADQYALGVVICEMLTGQYPVRSSPASTAAKPILPSGHHFSPRWEGVIRRCLEFRPEDRFPAIGDVAAALTPVRHAKVVWLLGGVAALATMLAGYSILRELARGPRVDDARQLTPGTDLSSRPSLSRDGTVVAYSSDRAETGNMDIWVQHLPSGQPIRLTTNPAEDVDPNLAPDGSAIVFRSERDGGGIYIVDSAGGVERLLAPFGRHPRFSPDGGSVAFWAGDLDDTVPSGQLFLMSLADRSIVRLAPEFADARLPVWSPDGKSLLFTGCRSPDQPLPACSEWWVMSRKGDRIENTRALAALRREEITLLDVGSWYHDAILFGGKRGATTSLWQIGISPTSLRAEGETQQLTSGDAREVAPSTSQNGAIAFEHLTSALHVWRVDNASNPAKSVLTKVTHDAALDISPNISSNGRWLVFLRGLGTKRDVWIRDTQSGSESEFLASAGEKLSPVIDDSGEIMVFEERSDGVPSILAVHRGQTPKKLCSVCSDPTSFFEGHRAVFYRRGSPAKIKMTDLGTGEAKTILEATGTSLSDASWSSQSEYLLFTASRDGSRKQVFAVSLPKAKQVAIGPWVAVTSEAEFSDRPRWSGDGRTVFYLSARDGFSCIWGRHFEPKSGAISSPPFPVMHYHNHRFSPGTVVERSFNLTTSGDSIYLNVGEVSASVWMGVIRRRGFFSLLFAPR